MFTRRLKAAIRTSFPRAMTAYYTSRAWLARKRAGEGNVRVFDSVFDENKWGDAESASGTGSNFAATAAIREELPPLLRQLGVVSLLDAPCGDFNWMRHVDLAGIDYTGVDVVPQLIARNEKQFGSAARHFVVRDIAAEPVPRADAVFCRDGLVHLSYALIGSTLRNFKQSGARFLMTTTFKRRERNWDIVTGDWRPLNLELPPFSFPPPLAAIDERCAEADGAFADKTLAVWRFEDLNP